MIITIVNGVVVEAETLVQAHYQEIKIVKKPYVPIKKKKNLSK